MKKFICILLTIAMMTLCVTPVFADNDGDGGSSGHSPTSKGSSSSLFEIKPDTGVIEGTEAKSLTENILGLVQFVGIAIAVGMLLYIGIKYMMASANEKADLKKGSVNYVIGAIVLLGASGIIAIIQAFADKAIE